MLSRKNPLSEEELSGVLAQLQQFEHNMGLIARVHGFFTFVNTVWLLAIAGIAISIGPALFALLRPVQDWLIRCAEWVFRRLVKPIVCFLHDYSILEVGAWLLCGGIVLEAKEHVVKEIALYIATTGMALTCPALAYSTFRHAAKLQGKDPQALHRMVSMWLAVTTAPLAMAHDSTLLAYASVMSCYAAIGFRVVAFGLCTGIGFRDDSTMERCAVTSFVLLSGMGGARFLNASFSLGVHLAPFRSAVSVFGSIVFFLAMLIMSSRFYHPSHRRGIGPSGRHPYLFVNFVTLVTLLGFMAVGLVGGLPGMANTATVFMVLWLVEKYADFHVTSAWNGWVLVLVLSVATWRGALRLHSSPDFISSLFDF